MSNVTITSTFADNQKLLAAELELERIGLDASQISVDTRLPVAPTDDVVVPTLASRAVGAAAPTALLAAVLGALVTWALGGPWIIGAAFGAGIGVLTGGYWGVASRLPVNTQVLDAADDDAALAEIVVEVAETSADEVIDVLVAANPVVPPTRRR